LDSSDLERRGLVVSGRDHCDEGYCHATTAGEQFVTEMLRRFLALAASPPLCRPCAGTGYVTYRPVERLLNEDAASRTCSTCHGRGTVPTPPPVETRTEDERCVAAFKRYDEVLAQRRHDVALLAALAAYGTAPPVETGDGRDAYAFLVRQTQAVIRAIDAIVPTRIEGMHPSLLHLHDVARAWERVVSAQADELAIEIPSKEGS
jgi:hypothetical protein